MRVWEGTEKMSGRPPSHSLLDAERESHPEWGGRGGAGVGEVKDNFHLKKYLFIVKFDNFNTL